MITPLQKHHGQNGVLAALFVLIAAIVVVVATHPRKAAPPPDDVARALPAVSTQKAAVPELTTIATTRGRPIETHEVAVRDLHRHARGAGAIGFDEKLTAHVYVPVSGWLVEVKKIGRTVKRGTPLGTLYSPEIVAAELELLKQVRDFRSQEELDVARRKLLRWGIPMAYLQRIEQTGLPEGKLPLWAWRDGSVVTRPALAGLFVEAQRELYTITNPAKAWVLVDIDEADAAKLAVGMPAKVAIAGRAKPATAKVGYIFSRVYAGQQTVRFELDGAFKRDAAATVEVDLGVERALAVPASAIVQSRGRTIVYVAQGEAADAREVTLGSKADDFYRVERGLAAGERVVINAQQLVDAAVAGR